MTGQRSQWECACARGVSNDAAERQRREQCGARAAKNNGVPTHVRATRAECRLSRSWIAAKWRAMLKLTLQLRAAAVFKRVCSAGARRALQQIRAAKLRRCSGAARALSWRACNCSLPLTTARRGVRGLRRRLRKACAPRGVRCRKTVHQCKCRIHLTAARKGALGLRRRPRNAYASRGERCSRICSRALTFNNARHYVEANFGIRNCVKSCAQLWLAIYLKIQVPCAGQHVGRVRRIRVSPLRRGAVEPCRLS